MSVLQIYIICNLEVAQRALLFFPRVYSTVSPSEYSYGQILKCFPWLSGILVSSTVIRYKRSARLYDYSATIIIGPDDSARDAL